MRLILLSIVSITALVLSGCSPKPASPEDVAREFAQAIHEDDLKTAAEYTVSQKLLDLGIRTKSEEAFSRALFVRDEFQVQSGATDGNKAVVKLKVTSPNIEISKSFQIIATIQSLAQTQSQSNLDKAAEAMVADNPTYSSVVSLDMVRTTTGWKVADNNQDFFKAAEGITAPLPASLFENSTGNSK